MAVSIIKKNGKKVTLLNPAEKGEKYADELRNGIRYTNDGRYKADKDGVILGLDKKQRAYRAGYLDARKDNAKAYRANKKKRNGGRRK